MAQFRVMFKGITRDPTTIVAKTYQVKDEFVNFYADDGEQVFTVAVANVFVIQRTSD